jgi:hypothetical protein
LHASHRQRAAAVIGYELFNRSRSGIGHTAATDVTLVFTRCRMRARKIWSARSSFS